MLIVYVLVLPPYVAHKVHVHHCFIPTLLGAITIKLVYGSFTFTYYNNIIITIELCTHTDNL